ncbi:hypothetical protein IT575_00835 [bacterium]|nr:hypothetical protein [bacterium]
MRSLAGLIQITATLGGLLFGTMLAIGLGVALDELFSIRQAIPSWLMAIFALIGCVVGLAKGSQWGEAWPRRTVERASDRVWKELRRPELALLAVQYDLPGLIAGLSGSEDWWRLALLAPGSSLKAQLKQAADFFPCLEAIIDERPQLQLRWRFVLCAFSRWVDEVTAFISRWFCCACLIPFGAFLIVLPLLPVLLLPIGVTLRRRAALIALCDFFASPEHPAGKPIRLQDK